MSDVLGAATLVAPALVTVGFPLALVGQVLADLWPGRGSRPGPTRAAGISGTAQAVLALLAGTALTRWETVPVALWWFATWLLALGVVALVLRWPALRPTGSHPRREVLGASVWVLLALGSGAFLVR